jgi:hypothetical protein
MSSKQKPCPVPGCGKWLTPSSRRKHILKHGISLRDKTADPALLARVKAFIREDDKEDQEATPAFPTDLPPVPPPPPPLPPGLQAIHAFQLQVSAVADDASTRQVATASIDVPSMETIRADSIRQALALLDVATGAWTDQFKTFLKARKITSEYPVYVARILGWVRAQRRRDLAIAAEAENEIDDIRGGMLDHNAVVAFFHFLQTKVIVCYLSQTMSLDV